MDRPIIRTIFTILSSKVFLKTHPPTPQSFQMTHFGVNGFWSTEILSDVFLSLEPPPDSPPRGLLHYLGPIEHI